jgi:hypothetical protein
MSRIIFNMMYQKPSRPSPRTFRAPRSFFSVTKRKRLPILRNADGCQRRVLVFKGVHDCAESELLLVSLPISLCPIDTTGTMDNIDP